MRARVAPVSQRQGRFIRLAAGQFQRLGQRGGGGGQTRAAGAGQQPGNASELPRIVLAEKQQPAGHAFQRGTNLALRRLDHAPGPVQGAEAGPSQDLVLLAQFGHQLFGQQAVGAGLSGWIGGRHGQHPVPVHQVDATHRAGQAAEDAADAFDGAL